jgi:hypothetical protein
MIRSWSRLLLRQALALMDHPIGIAVAALVIIGIDLWVTK